jgi:hypothetical protein
MSQHPSSDKSADDRTGSSPLIKPKRPWVIPKLAMESIPYGVGTAKEFVTDPEGNGDPNSSMCGPLS